MVITLADIACTTLAAREAAEQRLYDYRQHANDTTLAQWTKALDWYQTSMKLFCERKGS